MLVLDQWPLVTEIMPKSIKLLLPRDYVSNARKRTQRHLEAGKAFAVNLHARTPSSRLALPHFLVSHWFPTEIAAFMRVADSTLSSHPIFNAS